MITSVKRALSKAGIDIPFPTNVDDLPLKAGRTAIQDESS